MSELSMKLPAIKLRWLAQRTKPRPGLRLGDIEAFEKEHGVLLPNELSEYFQGCDGTSDDGSDPFWFLPLGNVVTAEKAGLSMGPHKHLYLIVDYLQLCYGYGIELSDQPSEQKPVYSLGFIEDKIVAPSFSAFLDLYLADDSSLHPPKPEVHS